MTSFPGPAWCDVTTAAEVNSLRASGVGDCRMQALMKYELIVRVGAVSVDDDA